VLLRCGCAVAALWLRALVQDERFAWEASQQRCPRLAPGALRIHLFKMCISPQRERHFASKPSLFLRKIAILTRGENGDLAWEVCTFHHWFYDISPFLKFSFPNARFVYAKRSFWSKTLNTSSVVCLFSKGQNGALASTACTFSKTMLSPLRNAHFRCHNRHVFKTALSPRRRAHFACS
jgi:hypothetical protein